MSRIYSSEFNRQKSEDRAWTTRLILSALAVGLAMIAVQRFDRADFDRAVDASLKYLAENTDYRSYVLTDVHCPAPRAGERLVMELATAKEAGKGYRCTYWIHVSYGQAPELTGMQYSRGRKP